MALPVKGHLLIDFLLVLSTITDVGAFLYDADWCSKFPEYKDIINLAHVENCLSIDQVFAKLKLLGDKSHWCLFHGIDQLGDRYGVSIYTPEDCQCNGTNSLLNYISGVRDGSNDMKDRCLSQPHYKALFDQFFVDNNNRAPACRSHHSVWFDLSHIDNDCTHDLIYHVTYSFDHHPSRCVCKQSVQYRDPNNCLQFHSYQELMKLYDTNLCSSKNSQWNLLNDLEIRSPDCRKKIITELAQHFHNYPSVGACQCSPVKNISNDEPVLNDDKRDQCSNVQHSRYSHLRQELFQGASGAGCATHFHLWQQLQNIQQSHGYDCTMDMIHRSANKYPSAESDPCKCEDQHRISTTTTTTTASPVSSTTQHISTTSTTTAPPVPHNTQHISTTSTTTAPPIPHNTQNISTTSTTTAPPVPHNRYRCRKYDLIADIAIGNHVHTNNSTPCESKISGTNEDLVISLCNMTSVEKWSRGAQVMSNCGVIPHYSPVATFSLAGKYQVLDGQSGVFLECIPDGFKMVIQSCDGGPQIIHVSTTGVFNNNATIYYAVV
ncbi:uncharacterized protein LOC127848933 [Dreissena polymorpha]|uniref:Ricin B lectin domain-containing protein n=1 Tax=Dreissena polymorpha TaxID=45954 RepID=A0A9D4DRJ6_DREPO|nr:uncharacterized protein LOC127848933 [Dreissena polymorpha]KAH3753928.1 hypothetical protein DPMN_188581 [Dreissena polymorpha]